MTRVSRHKVKSNIEVKIKDLLFELIAKLKKRNEVELFFDEFFTPTEKIMFAKRLAIAFMLVKGYGYEVIENTLRVSSATIEKVNYWIKHEGHEFKKMVDMLIQKEQREETWHNFWHTIESSTVTMSRGDWGARRRGINESHRKFESEHPI